MIIFTDKEESKVGKEELKKTFEALRGKGNLSMVSVVSFGKNLGFINELCQTGDIPTTPIDGRAGVDQVVQQITRLLEDQQSEVFLDVAGEVVKVPEIMHDDQ